MSTVTLDESERGYLQDLLELEMRNTQLELERTDAVAVREELQQRQKVIMTLLKKIHG